MSDKVMKQKTLCDGTVIIMEYKKLIQVNTDDKIEFFPVLDENENWVQLPNGKFVLYNENIGFPCGDYWVNYFVMPSTVEIKSENNE